MSAGEFDAGEYDTGEGRSRGTDGMFDTVSEAVRQPPAPRENDDLDADDLIEIIQRPHQAVTRHPERTDDGAVRSETIGLTADADRDDWIPGDHGQATGDGDTEAGIVPDLSQRLPKLTLPGYGEAYDECGDPVMRFCAGCGKPHAVGRTCNRSVCPRCAANWCRDRSADIAAKLDACRRKRYADEVDHGDAERMLLHHVAIVPPWHWTPAADDPLDATTDVVKDLLRRSGLEGYLFYHPWSGEDGDDRGAWKERQFQGRDWDDVRSELEHRPHFHAVVVGPHVPGGDVVAKLNEQTDWVLHRITKSEDSPVSLGNDADMMAAVQYALSHTGIRLAEENDDQRYNRAAFTYFGSTMAQVTAMEKHEKRIDALSRAVAPRVLGLKFNSLACSIERHERADHAVEIAMAASSKAWGASWSSSGQSLDSDHAGDLPSDGSGDLSGSAGDLPDQPSSDTADGSDAPGDDDSVEDLNGVDADDPNSEPSVADQDTTDDGQVRCRGRLLHIREAEDYLNDNAWVTRAPHADELRTAYHEYQRFGDATEAMGGAHDLDEDPYQEELDSPPPDAPAD